MQTEELPGVFVNCFLEKVSMIIQHIDTLPPNQSTHRKCNVWQTFSVKEEDIRKIVKSSPQRSCILDLFHTPLLLTLSDSLLPAVTDIINQSLQQGTMPKQFKHGTVVIPSTKITTLSSDYLKNYWPISNLPLLANILEKVSNKEIWGTVLLKTSLFQPNQSAYGKKTIALVLPFWNTQRSIRCRRWRPGFYFWRS